MALSYFTESEAPRDFRVSSTESDGHYKKCVLCYTVKRNFYCAECIRSGSFVHSSMPYSDKLSEKQAKLQRLKANRRHVLDRCEKLLAPKLKQDTLLTEMKQSRDKIDLIRLAIEQRRQNIEEKKKELLELSRCNNELRLKLPRYSKRVASLGKHAQSQKLELETKVSTFGDQAEALAALRRSRIRQLNKYIFPVYMTYDDASSNSIEDMEFVCSDVEEEVPRRCQLHVGAPSINADGDIQHLLVQLNESETASEGSSQVSPRSVRLAAALGSAAQLTALLANILAHPQALHITLSEYFTGRWSARVIRRLCGSLLSLSRGASLTGDGACLTGAGGGACLTGGALRPGLGDLCPLQLLHHLCMAAAADEPTLGRVEWYTDCDTSAWSEWEEEWREEEEDTPEPEHLTWPEGGELGVVVVGTPPPLAPASSLVTSAVASLADLWRGWAK